MLCHFRKLHYPAFWITYKRTAIKQANCWLSGCRIPARCQIYKVLDLNQTPAKRAPLCSALMLQLLQLPWHWSGSCLKLFATRGPQIWNSFPYFILKLPRFFFFYLYEHTARPIFFTNTSWAERLKVGAFVDEMDCIWSAVFWSRGRQRFHLYKGLQDIFGARKQNRSEKCLELEAWAKTKGFLPLMCAAIYHYQGC